MPVLQFKGKTAVENYHHTVAHHRLEFDPKLSLLSGGVGKGKKSGGPSLEGNLIIEGDNLLALKALLPTHAGKVKCIYIDPPYTPATKAGSTTTTSPSRSSRNGSARPSARKAKTPAATTSGAA